MRFPDLKTFVHHRSARVSAPVRARSQSGADKYQTRTTKQTHHENTESQSTPRRRRNRRTHDRNRAPASTRRRPTPSAPSSPTPARSPTTAPASTPARARTPVRARAAARAATPAARARTPARARAAAPPTAANRLQGLSAGNQSNKSPGVNPRGAHRTQ